MLGLVLVVILLIKYEPIIVWAVGKVIALPLKAIGATKKKVKERRKEKKEQKQNKPPDTDGKEV